MVVKMAHISCITHPPSVLLCAPFGDKASGAAISFSDSHWRQLDFPKGLHGNRSLSLQRSGRKVQTYREKLGFLEEFGRGYLPDATLLENSTDATRVGYRGTSDIHQ